MLKFIVTVSAGAMNVLRRIWRDYIFYDAYGDFILLRGRQADRSARYIEGVPEELVEEAFAMICESFDISDPQKWCMRLEDNLGDYYRTKNPWGIADDMEYDRLRWAMEARIGEFEWEELSSDINVTIEEIIKFMADRETA